uniref:MYND-type domain-containing protein n=1 Tax=Panagrolaimus sp. PS1159 TaxID=55785 RepID=A0AC35FRV4_9BILA
MATKNCDFLLPEIYQNPPISNNESQFNNLNLNQNQNYKVGPVGSKIKSYENTKDKKKDFNNFDQQSKKNFLYSFDNNQSQSITSEYLNGFQNAEKNWKKGFGSNDISSDILSLYISAVENDETNDINDQSLAYQNSGKTLKDLNHEFRSKMFEIPRQQKDETKEPEIMQFKSSQKLINPNQSKFEQLKEKANKLFQEEKYNEAIEIYTEVLQLSGLSFENQAVIYSNRSATYLLLKSEDSLELAKEDADKAIKCWPSCEDSLELAKEDADKAIKCWPSWWKGYYRLARVHVVQENWNEAERLIQHAFAMNSESKFVRDEISYVRKKTGMLSRQEKYNEAIKAYSEILGLSDLSAENQATIYSNRSASYLLVGNSLNNAKIDAEKAIKLWSSWWKGYYRLARVNVVQEEWRKAETNLKKGLALNSGSKEIRDELSFVRSQIGETLRGEKNNPAFAPPTPEEETKKLCNQLGISEKKFHYLQKNAKNFPKFDYILKGHQYRDGFVVPQDFKKAAEFYDKAANLGNSEGMFNLGLLYKQGKGVKRDYGESMKWFLKAANSKSLIMRGSGIAEAQHSIGLNYAEGVGVEQDYRKAAEWFEKAVANNFGPSANNLGMLYLNGLGVERSAVKAFNYFKFSAERGDTTALINLADCYFDAVGTVLNIPTQEYIDEGKKWLRRAVEKCDIRAVAELRKRENMNFLLHNVLSEKFSELFLIEKNEPLNYEQYGKYIEEAAKNGSITAQKHMETWKYLDDAMEAFKKNDPEKLVKALANAIRLNPPIVGIPELFDPIIEKRIQTHTNELDTIICYIKLDIRRPSMAKYIPDAFKKFPDDECLAEMTCFIYLYIEDFEAAFNHIEIFLKRHPNFLPLIIWKSRILRKLKPESDEFLKSIDEFLASAPEDNRHIPSCYYNKAFHYYFEKNIQEFIKFYEAGLAAENKQLPCYLPYLGRVKRIMEPLYMLSKNHNHPKSGEKRENREKGNPTSSSLEQIKSDPKRKLLLLQQRELFIGYAETYGLPRFPKTVLLPPCTPNPPNWDASPKEITLKDMDPTKDKVYNGCFIKVRIIEWPLIANSIQTKIEDENGDVNRLAIYNWPETGIQKYGVLEAMKIFRPNIIVSIINPYHRISMDGQSTIRVEGPDFVKFTMKVFRRNVKILIIDPYYRISSNGEHTILVESPEFIKLDTSMINKLCHVCGEEAKELSSCPNCKMAIYCSNECDKLDWTEFNHKGISSQNVFFFDVILFACKSEP